MSHRSISAIIAHHTPLPRNDVMPPPIEPMAEQIARAATTLQQQRTGHAPTSVSVVLNGNTLVVTFQGALSPAEQAMARNAEGATRVQDFHRQLFASSAVILEKEIKRITGMDVREATALVEPKSASVVQVFTTGTMVQVFLLSGAVPPGSYDAALKT